MATEDELLNVFLGDEVKPETGAERKRRTAEPTPVPLSHQVAGHKFGIHKVGILQHFDGTVLKQLQPPPRGPCEMQFYTQVFAEDCTAPQLLTLQQHLPKYYGTWSPLDKPNEIYLKLEDVAGRFACPCIMDVKIGRKSYDPFASKGKQEEQIRKYPLMEEIGFLILGMRVYHVALGSYFSYDQFYGRSLTKETLKTGLARFFHNGEELRKDAISLSIHKIYNILQWFESQKQLHFYASSLLFVYEGCCHIASAKNESEALTRQKYKQDKLQTKRNSLCRQVNCSSSSSSDPFEVIHKVNNVNKVGLRCPNHLDIGMIADMEDNVEVKMIDFAHVFPSDNLDNGYMYGLKSLLFVLEQIIQDY